MQSSGEETVKTYHNDSNDLIAENDMDMFAEYFREQFPDVTFPPKFHMLEDHVVEFIRDHKFPLGLFGEQGEESIHHELQGIYEKHNHVQPLTKRLQSVLESHFCIVLPKNREIIPEMQTRNPSHVITE